MGGWASSAQPVLLDEVAEVATAAASPAPGRALGIGGTLTCRHRAVPEFPIPGGGELRALCFQVGSVDGVNQQMVGRWVAVVDTVDVVASADDSDVLLDAIESGGLAVDIVPRVSAVDRAVPAGLG